MHSRTLLNRGTTVRLSKLDAAANADAVVTVPAYVELCNHVHHIQWSYDGVPTGGLLTVQDGAGGTILWQQAITAGGPGGQDPDIVGTLNTAIVVTLKAAGAGITGRIAAVRVARVPQSPDQYT